MLSSKTLQENHRLFYILYALFAISIISVFRHGTTLLYLVLWGYLFYTHGNPLKTLKKSAEFALKIPFIFLTLLMGFGILSTLWSIHPMETLIQSSVNALTFASFAIFFAVLIQDERVSSKQMIQCMIIIFVVSFIALMVQALSEQTIRDYLHHSGRGLKPNAEVLSIFVLPLIAYFLYQKRVLWGGLFYLAALILTYIVQIRTSFIALGVGAIFAIFFYGLPRFMIWCATIGSVVYTLACPWIISLGTEVKLLSPQSSFPESFIHRLYIWNFVAEKIKEKPWFGWGVNVSHSFPGGKEKVALSSWMDRLPSHPHNEVMQIWLEQGLIGALLLACFHGTLFWQLRQFSNRLAISMYGFFLISVLIMLGMSHSIWHKWWMTWIALCGGLLIALSPKNVSRETFTTSSREVSSSDRVFLTP